MLRALARHWRERCLRQRAARRTAVRLVQALPKTSCRVWADARTRVRARVLDAWGRLRAVRVRRRVGWCSGAGWCRAVWAGLG